MIGFHSPLPFTVVQLGPLPEAEVSNALYLANSLQRPFSFTFYHRKYSVKRQFRFLNAGWDLDAAVESLIRDNNLPKPLIFFTSLPYSDWENRKKADWFYFGDYSVNGDREVMLVSTHLWESLHAGKSLESYIFFSLAAAALSYTTALTFHEETRSCVFDYCDEPNDIDRAMATGSMCPDCERYLSSALRAGRIGIEQLAAARKLLKHASGRRVAFVVMPFQPRFNAVHTTIRGALENAGWEVIRADQVAHPRRITDAIVQTILASDLVVADLTGENPNVFYEVGLAHAAGIDVLLLSQARAIPFDLRVERAVFYKPTDRGLKKLSADLRASVS